MRLTRCLGSMVLLCLMACGQAPDSTSNLYGNPSLLQQFPIGPQEDLTPGLLCRQPDEYRYPEKIAYCRRNVSSSLKNLVIQTYDETHDYQIAKMNRADFKIDHYIPLCMGGDNHAGNLWPQHKTIYDKTDRLEGKLCELMSRALMTQAEAIDRIKYTKLNLDKAATVEQQVDQLLGK
jgi:hypothetical protein